MVGDRISVLEEGVPSGTRGGDSPLTFNPPSPSGKAQAESDSERSYCHEGRTRGIGKSRQALRSNAVTRDDGRPSVNNQRAITENVQSYYIDREVRENWLSEVRVEPQPCPTQGADCDITPHAQTSSAVGIRGSFHDQSRLLDRSSDRAKSRYFLGMA